MLHRRNIEQESIFFHESEWTLKNTKIDFTQFIFAFFQGFQAFFKTYSVRLYRHQFYIVATRQISFNERKMFFKNIKIYFIQFEVFWKLSTRLHQHEFISLIRVWNIECETICFHEKKIFIKNELFDTILFCMFSNFWSLFQKCREDFTGFYFISLLHDKNDDWKNVIFHRTKIFLKKARKKKDIIVRDWSFLKNFLWDFARSIFYLCFALEISSIKVSVFMSKIYF